MGVELAIGAALLGGASSIIGGAQQRKEAKKQAMIAEENAQINADLERENAETTRSSQKVAFLKSGVTLAGSPMLLMQETFERGEKNARAQIKSGQAQAGTLRRQGDAAFMQGVTSGFQNAGSAVLSGYNLGAFGGGTKTPAPVTGRSTPAAGTNLNAFQTA